jgi:hypothetical protein
VHDLFIDPFAQSPLTQLFQIFDQHQDDFARLFDFRRRRSLRKCALE